MELTLEKPAGQRIAALVTTFLAKRRPEVEVGAEQDLRNAGLTSLDLMNLMLAVESEFDVFIPETQMTPDNFRSVRAIEALVTTLA
ncbi:MAG TPA: phosphopantetheine-binding protein [Caulobacteraceae bacterium]|jgi:acyl carrier protein